MSHSHETPFSHFGFKSGKGSVHTSRTLMLDELKKLINYCSDGEFSKNFAENAIITQNCLGKRSAKTRVLTFRHLVELYGLDPKIPVFRALLYFWKKDEAAHPMIALLCAITRDPLLHAASILYMNLSPGSSISREEVEEFIDKHFPGRFSPATLKSTAQNINSSWTKSGHLLGKVKKKRILVIPTSAAVSYALFIGYLQGIRGENLFNSEFIRLLDCSFEKALERAETAASKSWLILKRVGNVIEVQFPNLISPEEMEVH